MNKEQDIKKVLVDGTLIRKTYWEGRQETQKYYEDKIKELRESLETRLFQCGAGGLSEEGAMELFNEEIDKIFNEEQKQ